MSEAKYCSQVCGAKCCRAHGRMAAPRACPMLTADNLCSIYPRRLGFTFKVVMEDGERVKCVCSRPEVFMPQLPAAVLAQCCIAHPELLEAK